MQIKHFLIARTIRLILWLLLKTCKFRLHGADHFLNLPASSPCIIMLWHNRLVLIGPAILKSKTPRLFTAFISNSKDGDIASAYTTSYPIGRVIRVPHDNKKQALQTLIEKLQSSPETAIITPDGPRGPIYQVKPGTAIAALESGAKVIPFSWECSNYFEFKSWDRFRLPKPFSVIDAYFGAPIDLEKEKPLEEHLKDLKEKLDALSAP